jgi:hypothetical protein
LHLHLTARSPRKRQSSFTHSRKTSQYQLSSTILPSLSQVFTSDVPLPDEIPHHERRNPKPSSGKTFARRARMPVQKNLTSKPCQASIFAYKSQHPRFLASNPVHSLHILLSCLRAHWLRTHVINDCKDKENHYYAFQSRLFTAPSSLQTSLSRSTASTTMQSPYRPATVSHVHDVQVQSQEFKAFSLPRGLPTCNTYNTASIDKSPIEENHPTDQCFNCHSRPSSIPPRRLSSV